MRVVLRRHGDGAVTATAQGRSIHGTEREILDVLELARALVGGLGERAGSLTIFELLGEEQRDPVIHAGVSLESSHCGDGSDYRLRVAKDVGGCERALPRGVKRILGETRGEAAGGEPFK